MAYTYQGKIIREGRGWTDANGIKHPPNWASWSDAEKAAKGLVWHEPPASYDNRFWWDADTPKDIATLKPEWVAKVKEQAGSLLAATDWYVVRQADTGQTMPPKVLAYREAVRAAVVQIEDDLMNTADHAAFVTVATSITWPDPDAELTPEELLDAERKIMRCSALQGRMVLAQMDQIAAVEALIAQADAATQVAWEYAVEWQRNSPMMLGLAATMFTPEQMDDLFRAAMLVKA